MALFFTDLGIAVVCYLVSAGLATSTAALLADSSTQSYALISTQKRLLDASEFLVSSDSGLAIRYDNELKHHQLDVSRISGKGQEALSEMLLVNASLRITSGGNEMIHIGDCNGITVKRIALCNDEVCILELSSC